MISSQSPSPVSISIFESSPSINQIGTGTMSPGSNVPSLLYWRSLCPYGSKGPPSDIVTACLQQSFEHRCLDPNDKCSYHDDFRIQRAARLHYQITNTIFRTHKFCRDCNSEGQRDANAKSTQQFRHDGWKHNGEINVCF